MRDKSLATAVATLLAAFATAHLMQYGLSAGRALSDEERSPIGLASLIAGPGEASAMPEQSPDLPSLSDNPAELSAPPRRMGGFPRDAEVPARLGRTAASAFGIPCGRDMMVWAEPAAMLRIALSAPCDPGIRIEIGHAGLRFAMETARDGSLELLVPAMTQAATVQASFADGTVLTETVHVEDAGRIERVAVASEGWSALSLHPVQSGVRHAWTQGDAMGQIHRLGDPAIDAPFLAEVFTRPVGRFGALGGARLRIEAEVTTSNCARDVTAETVTVTPGTPPERATLRLAMPSCEAAGDILVIGDIAPALHLARN